MKIQIEQIDYSKMDGVIIAVVQNKISKQVLMVGVMDKKALQITFDTQNITFWSRTHQKYWTKGETRKNFLKIEDLESDILVDCDCDTILFLAKPLGPTCHTDAVSCFQEKAGDIRVLG